MSALSKGPFGNSRAQSNLALAPALFLGGVVALFSPITTSQDCGSRSTGWDSSSHHRRDNAQGGRDGHREHAWRRRSGSARHCISFNKQIIQSGATSEVCSLIDQHVAEFNHVNVSTAFRKLLQAPRAGMPRGVVEHSLETLEQRALQTMEDFGPQAIANTLHMTAKKRYRPKNAALLPALEGRLRAVAVTW